MVFLDDEYVSESFNDLDLKGAEVSAKQFDSCVFTQCNFSEVKLNRTSFVDCEFTNFNLSLLKINYGKFVDVQFRCSRLIGIDWTKVAWPNLALNAPLSFMDCNLSDGSFFGLSLLGLVMHECKAHNADFREGNFSHADFRNTDFSDSLFGNSVLNEADFVGASNYDININNNQIKQAKFSRFEALSLLNGLDVKLVD